MQALLHQIAETNGLTIRTFDPLAGGDINDVYLLKCIKTNIVVKLNNSASFPEMFGTEARGLQLLASSNSFRIPSVVAVGTVGNMSYLLLEYIEPSSNTSKFWTQFAEQLATLHRTSNKRFGLSHNNYIGSLPQYNSETETATDFYISQRLEPQFKLAAENGYSFQNLSSFYRTISEEIPNEPPSLIHGDLWSGNYLATKNSEAVLIDPAVAFAPREMDLAMMQLFGGFPKQVFSAYNEIFPLQKNWEKRTTIFQLYYVLVHLNLFGDGYLPQVTKVLNDFS